jgi:hypothetical protein
VVGSSAGWAVAVILLGAALIALAAVIARRRDLSAPNPAI